MHDVISPNASWISTRQITMISTIHVSGAITQVLMPRVECYTHRCRQDVRCARPPVSIWAMVELNILHLSSYHCCQCMLIPLSSRCACAGTGTRWEAVPAKKNPGYRSTKSSS